MIQSKFIKVLFSMFLPMISVIRCNVDEDIGGGDGGAEDDQGRNDFLNQLTNNEASPDTGKVTAEVIPNIEKDDSGKKPTGKTQEKEGSPQGKDQPPEQDEVLLQNLGFGESPEAKAQRLERDYKQSSKEAIRLATREKAVTSLLESKGMQLHISEDGKEVKLLPIKGYKESANDDDFKIDLSDLDDTNLLRIESGDPAEVQKVINEKLAEIRKNQVRLRPTGEEDVPQLPDEQIDAIFSEMKESIDANGESSFPEINDNAKFIKQMLKNDTIPKPMRDLFHKHPREMGRWMNALVEVEKGKIRTAQKKAFEAAQQKSDKGRKLADVSVQSTGAVRSTDGSPESSFLDRMLKA